MHQILHGITRSFLAACGGSLLACLPVLHLFGEVAETISDHKHDGDPLLAQDDRVESNGVLQPTAKLLEGEGDLLPHSGEEADGNLQPKLLDGEGDFLPQNGEDEDEGCLLPMNSGDGEGYMPLTNAEAQGCLLPIISGAHVYFTSQVNGEAIMLHQDLHPQIEADEQSADENFMLLPNTVTLLSSLHAWRRNTHICFLDIQEAYISVPMLEQNHDEDEEGHPPQSPTLVIPIPRPRVKMKAEINLFFLTTDMLDPGIWVAHMYAHSWEHAAWAFPSSPSTTSINSNLTEEDHLHLTGKVSHVFYMMQTKTKIQMIMMQLWLFYLTKDVLEPSSEPDGNEGPLTPAMGKPQIQKFKPELMKMASSCPQV